MIGNMFAALVEQNGRHVCVVDDPFQEQIVRSRIQCGSACLANPLCVLFTYFQSKNACLTYVTLPSLYKEIDTCKSYEIKVRL